LGNAIGEMFGKEYVFEAESRYAVLRDALADLGKEEQVRVMDIAEVVVGALR